MKTIMTIWQKRTYDVWGNKDDGFFVNDSYNDGLRAVRCKVTKNNAGTTREFLSASPSDGQLQKIFGFFGKIDVDGDDTHITVNRASDGYPLGELLIESHESLSPIREIRGYDWETALYDAR